MSATPLRLQQAVATLAFAVLTLAPNSTAPADPPRPPHLPPALEKQAQAAIDRGLEYLKAAQDREGGWTPKYGPAITAIVGQAFAQHPDYGPRHPLVRRCVDIVLRHRREDGGLYTPGLHLANYQTAVALSFVASVDDSKLAPVIRDAQRFLRELQFDERESVPPDDPWYGGAGYTEKKPRDQMKRPDLSNTQMMLEALHASGMPSTDPAFQRGLKFITRCQMLAATNDQPFAAGSTDGGFIYSAADGGQSKAGEIVREGPRRALRSYGSMTYAGFKSMLYAGLDRDDPRVRAAHAWLGRHYTLDANANMPEKQSQEGLYYYYHVFARALHAWGEPTLTDAQGRVHLWRVDLCRKLISLQRSDGSWINEADRWNEGDPNYVTALAVLSMQTALRP